MANAMTAARLALVLPTGILMATNGSHAAWLAAVAIVVAIVTDLLDGPLARRLGTATPAGRVFDHSTDFLFVVTGMAGGVLRGVFPLTLPAVVVAAYGQYVIDSLWFHQQRGLRGNQLGRYNGVLYFFPLCGDTLARLGLEFLRPAIPLVCWMLVLSTGLSIGQRLLALRRRAQADPASPAEETAV